MQGNPIVEAVFRHARERPTAPAIRDANSSLDYAGLAAALTGAVDRLAESDARNLLLDADNGIPWAVADLAAMAVGLTVTPIPPFFTAAQIAHVATATDADLVFASTDRAPRWWQDQQWDPAADIGGLAAFKRHGAGEGAQAFAGKITFTSGSTGAPKGVMLSNAVLADTSAGIVEALAPLAPREHISVLPLATLLENTAGLYAPLLHGSACYLPGKAQTGLSGASLDFQAFCDLLNGSRADTVILVPQLLTAVVALTELGMLLTPDFRLMAVGGGRVSRSLLSRAEALGLPVCEGYGLSECGSVLTLNLPGLQRPGSVGRPLSHARLRVSERGEIEVKEPLMAGYLDMEKRENAIAATREDPASACWYRTGDLGHFDNDGYLYIDGRSRNVFITSYGRNVNPEWPEAALTQDASIAQALVTGEARDHNLALLWPRGQLTQEQVQAVVDRANAELPDYAQVHRWIALAEPLDPALQTENGRLRRAAAMQRFAPIIDQHFAGEAAAPLRRQTATHETTRSEDALL